MYRKAEITSSESLSSERAGTVSKSASFMRFCFTASRLNGWCRGTKRRYGVAAIRPHPSTARGSLTILFHYEEVSSNDSLGPAGTGAFLHSMQNNGYNSCESFRLSDTDRFLVAIRFSSPPQKNERDCLIFRRNSDDDKRTSLRIDFFFSCHLYAGGTKNQTAQTSLLKSAGSSSPMNINRLIFTIEDCLEHRYP